VVLSNSTLIISYGTVPVGNRQIGYRSYSLLAARS